jgi:hypothetical protein
MFSPFLNYLLFHQPLSGRASAAVLFPLGRGELDWLKVFLSES